jgi:hypothetical protein
MSNKLRGYLEDPLLNRLYTDIRNAGAIRSISVDITHACNIRCDGCYFFAEEMDHLKAPKDEAEFDAFVQQELERGTTYITIIGGEPSLMLNRVKKLYDNFKVLCVTNGMRKIPVEGFENMPIVVSVWGDHDTDTRLRGGGKIDVFAKGLANFKNDERAVWYYTTTPGNAHEIEGVVNQCVENGNYIMFNFYGDIKGYGGALDHRAGFDVVRRNINRMIERYPDRIMSSSYISQVVSTGNLQGEHWGYDVCCSVSTDNPKNEARLANGKAANTHFRAYNPDLKSTRRCCVGDARDCNTCLDVWAHYSWIMLSMKRHLDTKEDFTNWLTTMYMFYLINRVVDFRESVGLLPEIHQAMRYLREGEIGLAM